MHLSNIILISYRHLDSLYPIGKLFIKKDLNTVDPDLAFQYEGTWIKKGFSLGSDLPLSTKIYYTRFTKCFKFLLDLIGPDWLEVIPNTDAKNYIDSIEKSICLKEDAYKCCGAYGNIILGNELFNHAPVRLTKQSAKDIYQAVDALNRNPGKLSKENFLYLLKYASCLRGKHPKFSVFFENENTPMVFRPLIHSKINMNLWRFITNKIAHDAFLDIVNAHYQFNGYIEQRIDYKDNNRLTILSARTLSNKDVEKISWLDVADIINIYGAHPKDNLIKLYRRLVFDALTMNEQDTPENIWFYRTPLGWELCPMNAPLPKIVTDGVRTMAMPVIADNRSASHSLILKICPYFGLKNSEAKNILLETQKVSSRWREYAKKYGASTSEIETLAPSFEN